MYAIIIKDPKDSKLWFSICEKLQKTGRYSYSTFEEVMRAGKEFKGTKRYYFKIYSSTIDRIYDILPILRMLVSDYYITFEKEDVDLQELLFIQSLNEPKERAFQNEVTKIGLLKYLSDFVCKQNSACLNL